MRSRKLDVFRWRPRGIDDHAPRLRRILFHAALAPDPTALLVEARHGFERAGMLAYAHAARWRLGGDDRREAEAFFAAQQVARPERFVAMLAPGFRIRRCLTSADPRCSP